MKSVWTPALLGALIFVMVLLIAYALMVKKSSADAQFNNLERSKGFGRYMAALGRETAAILPDSVVAMNREKSGKIAAKLKRAGNPWGITPVEFVVLKFSIALAAFVGGVLAGILLANCGVDMIEKVPWFVYPVVFAVGGFFAPDYQLKVISEQRELAFKKDLPEALDLIIISMSTNNNVDGAIKQMTPLLKDGIVKNEFQTVKQDLMANDTLEHALEQMSERTPSADLEAFVNAVIMASNDQNDPTDALKRRAATSRAEYINLLDQKIASLESRIMIYLSPTLLLSMVIVSIAPSMSTLMGSFGSM